jgi:hypothetical protein
MIEKRKPNKYWTYEKCKAEALKYETMKLFRNECKGAYGSIKKNKWLGELCSHLIYEVKPKGYWTKERCHIEALKHEHRVDFKNGGTTAYSKSIEFGWIDEVCSHMSSKTSSKMRYIYKYTFIKTNSVYIGLTWDKYRRNYDHMNDAKSNVYKHISENGFTEDDFELTYHGYFEKDVASKKEHDLIEEYRVSSFNLLNVAKGGNLGSSNVIWTKKKCIKIANTYTKRSEFKKKNGAVYEAIRRNGWAEELLAHIPNLNNMWTYETCKTEALKYSKRFHFKKMNSSAFNVSYKKGWLDEFFPKNSISQ